MKLNVAFNVNFPHILLMFLLFILYLRYTNHMHKSWWKNEKMTNEISNENPEVTITPHPKKSLYVSKTSYNNQIYQKEGHLPEMSWTKSLRTHRRSIFSAEATNTLMDGWWADGWMDGWVREQTEQRLVSRSFGIWSRKSGDDESLRVSEALKQGWWSKRPLPSSSSKRVCVHARATAPSAGHAVSGKTSPSLCAVFTAPRPFLTFAFQHPVALSFSSCLCTTRFHLFLCHAPVKFSYSLHVTFLGYFPLTFRFSIYVNVMFFQRSFSVTLNHPQDRSVTGSGYSKKDKSAFFLYSQQELCVLWGKFLGLNPKKKKTCRMFSGIIGLTKSWD